MRPMVFVKPMGNHTACLHFFFIVDTDVTDVDVKIFEFHFFGMSMGFSDSSP